MTMPGGSVEDPTARSRPAVGEAIIGAGVLALAIVTFWQTLSIPVSPIYAKVGPTVVPMMTAAALGLLGVLLLIYAWQGGWQTEEEKAVRPDRSALLWVIAGLVLNVALIGSAGFTIASTILFVCVARGFGSRRVARDLGIGLVMSLGIFLFFVKLLNVNLPAGWLAPLLGGAGI